MPVITDEQSLFSVLPNMDHNLLWLMSALGEGIDAQLARDEAGLADMKQVLLIVSEIFLRSSPNGVTATMPWGTGK